MTTHAFRYGRKLEDFAVGDTYNHPWEVTVDAGMRALFQASFLDATPTYASSAFARQLGFADRPLPPLLVMNLGLSFSVHDVSEQAIAHLAYLDVRFPRPAFEGDTLTASSKVLGVKPSGTGDKGVVHVRTTVASDRDDIVCAFERKALVRGGRVSERPESPKGSAPSEISEPDREPRELAALANRPSSKGGFAGFFEDFSAGDVLCHRVGKTVGDSEHMQLTLLMRNSHPIHFDERYCQDGNSFAGTRVVYGGLVFSFIASLASRDFTGNVLWDVGFDDGAHPSGVVAGDTLYAATKILETRSLDAHTGEVTARLVGVRNARPEALLDEGKDLFAAERDKGKEDRVKEKVFEVTRRVRMLKRAR